MKTVLQIGTLLVALLLGVVPPGTCARLAFNPHGSCCPVQLGEAANESACCKDGGSCSKHSKKKSNLPSPCCAFMPGDLAFVENSSTATHLLDAPALAAMPTCVFDALPLAADTASSTYAHAPPGAAPPCLLYILHASLLV